MFLFENKKRGKNIRIVKILGQVVYIVTSGYRRRTQRFLGDLISTLKVRSGDTEIKSIKFLDHEISKRIETEDFLEEYIGNKLVKHIDLIKKFKNKYNKYIKNYNDIFVLNANSGEIYLFLTYVLGPFIKKNNCKKILLIASKKYHMDLINLICPEMEHVYIKNIPVFKNLCKKIDDKRFFTMFTGDHFIQVEDDIKNNPIDTSHYFYSILKNLNISTQELDYKKVTVAENIKSSVAIKANKIRLNLDNFVFLAPEAASCEEYDNEFWVELTNEFQKNGIDVFMNIVDEDTDIIGCNYKSCSLSFSEAFALSQTSKGVVSLRSGLTESLLQTGVPLFSLYTKFRNRCVFNDMAVEYVLSGFGLSKLPNINPDLLYEYNMSELRDETMINQIVSEVKKHKENKIEAV